MAEASMLDENGDLQVQKKRKEVIIPCENEEWMPRIEVSTVEATIDRNCTAESDPTLDVNSLHAQLSELRSAASNICKKAFAEDEAFLLNDKLELTFGDVFALKAGKEERALAEFLSKIWSIKESEAEHALEENTILYNHPAANNLSRRATYSDQRNRYKRICSIFFTDTFFVHKKATTKEEFTCM